MGKRARITNKKQEVKEKETSVFAGAVTTHLLVRISKYVE
jgi:hypothetical protein